MTTQLMRTLNNLFYKEDTLPEFRSYLENKNAYKNEEYKNKFKQPPFTKFKLINGLIVHVPTKMVVIENDEQKEKALNELFDDSNTWGKGMVQFYKYVATKFINITREDIYNYLQTKGFFQMTQNIKKRTNKPIVAKYNNQTWAIDLIDLNEHVKANKGWRYIMTIVDIFSRKVWLKKLKQKEANETKDALEQLINELGIKPKYVMQDNGTEWLGEFEIYCKENNIKQLFTRSYSPEANGVVERMNKEIRKIIRAFFVRNYNTIWHSILDKVQDNKNQTYNQSVKGKPDDIWTPTYELTTKGVLPDRDFKFKARKSLLDKAEAKIKKFKEEDNLQEGELVRVKMSSIFANIRRLVKEGNTKQIIVTYTPEIFIVSKVVKVRNNLLERNKYVLENADGKILKKNGVTQMFYASELLRFKGEDASDVDISMEMALKLNNVETNKNDVDY